MRNQRGSITIAAIGIMLILGLMMAAILPAVSNEAVMGKKNSDLIEARLAAEAGAKRAIIDIKNNQNNWGWLKQDINLIAGDDNRVYNVSIKNSSNNDVLASGVLTAGNNYTITSIGKINGVNQTVTNQTVTINVQLPATGGSGGLLDLASFEDAVFAGGALVIGHGSEIGGDVEANGAMVLDKKVTVSGSATPNAGVAETEKPMFYGTGLFALDNFSDGAAFPTSGYVLDQVKYYSSSGWTIDKNATLTAAAPSKVAVIYVNGNIIVEQNIQIAEGSTVMFVATGNISIIQNINKSNGSSLILVAGGNINIAQNSSFDGAIIANGSITIGHNAEITYSASAIGAADSALGFGAGSTPIFNWNYKN